MNVISSARNMRNVLTHFVVLMSVLNAHWKRSMSLHQVIWTGAWWSLRDIIIELKLPTCFKKTIQVTLSYLNQSIASPVFQISNKKNKKELIFFGFPLNYRLLTNDQFYWLHQRCYTPHQYYRRGINPRCTIWTVKYI
jgi:hypothetical protein